MVAAHTENLLIASRELRVIVKKPTSFCEQKSIKTFWKYYPDGGREPRQVCPEFDLPASLSGEYLENRSFIGCIPHPKSTRIKTSFHFFGPFLRQQFLQLRLVSRRFIFQRSNLINGRCDLFEMKVRFNPGKLLDLADMP